MRNYPEVPRRVVTDTYFGVTVEDPYRYMEDKDAPEVKAIVAAENAYTKAFFDSQPKFSAAKKEQELRSKPHPLTLTDVQECNGRFCAVREVEGGLREIVSVDEHMRVLGVIANDATFNERMHVYSVKPCPGHPDVYAIMAVKHGAPRCCVVVYDAAKKEILGELDGTFGYSWSKDGSAVLYSDAVVDAANNRNINYARRYLWQTKTLETLYTHEENAVFMYVNDAPGGYFFQVLATYDDVVTIYQDKAGSRWKLNEGKGSCVYLGEAAGRCFFKTNLNAPMGHVVSLTLAQLREENALVKASQEALPQTDALLSAAAVLPEGLLALYERDAAAVMALPTHEGVKLHDVAMPSAYGHASAEEAMEVSDKGHIYLTFESFTQTARPMVYDVAAGTLRTLGAPLEDDSDIAVEQCFLNARDGQRILVYLVRPKDLKPNGNTPVLMYGYGGYAASSNPWPEDMVTGQNIVEWVRMGRIYAHCIIRGGSEYGAAWHEAAMGLGKKNAFYDFIDIAEYLIHAGWTKPSKLIATGLSNGGLLMTAISTLRPDLFGIVVASVPHTDMLRFRGDPRGMMYITEYGDPQGGEEMFRYMYSYSPYHNIKPGTVYPKMYVQTGEMDNNVPPYHGKKFAVRMQHDADEQHPVLLQVLAHGSHDRGVGDEYYQNIAQMQTFIEICLAEEE